jgi:DNA-binding MarR family transcriptional regulator
LIDRLEQAGLVSRLRSEEDRRIVNVSITPAGQDVLARLDAPLFELHQKVMAHFSLEELQELIRLLEKARQPCEEESI